MSESSVIEIGRQALEVTLVVAGPLLAASLFIGVFVSLIQVATSIQDVTLTFVPKILVVTLLMMVLGPWMIRMLVDFTQRIFAAIPGATG